MLQSTWKLSPFANGVTGFRPFANGLTFQAVCKRVTRLDAKDRFLLCVDLSRLIILRTMYRPYKRESTRDNFLFLFLLLRAERNACKVKNCVKAISWDDRTSGQPLSPFGLT